MDKPKCPLCKHKHYSYEPCTWKGEPEKAVETAQERQKKSSKERVKRWQKKHREEYNAKMREYRRKKKASRGSDPSPPLPEPGPDR